MIEDPPLLTVQRPSRRPSTEQIAALAAAPTGNIADCMRGRGALAPFIRNHNATHTSICGPALTCFAYPADNLGIAAALHFAQAGDVIVCANDACSTTALVGDLMCGMMKNRGVAGLVTDGLVRDIAGIDAWDFPVYCGGTSPNSPAKTGPGEVGLPITLGGRLVATGDMIVADRDGVVVVPFGDIDDIIKQVQRLATMEQRVEQSIREGLSEPGDIAALLESNNTRWLD